jgi:hypothetical protein
MFLGGHTETVQLLLEQPGIRTDLKNKEGQTPAGIAKTTEVAATIARFSGSAKQADTLAGGDEDDD